MDQEKKTCCFCGVEIDAFEDQNSPFPANTDPDAVCCEKCNMEIVIPARIEKIKENTGEE